MKILLKAICLFLLPLFVACCPLISINPLSETEKAYVDQRLLGTWQLQDDDSSIYLHIGKTKENMTHVISVEHNTSGGLDVMQIVMFPAEIGGNAFMSIDLKKSSENNKPVEMKSEESQSYYFIRYGFPDADILSITLIDEKVISKAIKAGMLKGTVTEEEQTSQAEGENTHYITKVECLQLTDSTENLIKYFKSVDIDKLFPPGDAMKFKKIQ